MKKRFLLILALMATACLNTFASPIDSYQQLTTALRKGKKIVILLDLEQSTGKSGMPTGYFAPNALMLVPAKESSPEHVSTSLLHFTDQSGAPTYEYVKYTFYPDNTVMIRTTCYDPVTFQLLKEPRTFNTSLNKGLFVTTSDKKIRDFENPPNWPLRPR